MASKRLKIRRADACVGCQTHLPVGTFAIWDSEARTITCLACAEGVTPASSAVPTAPTPPAEATSEPKPLDRGVAGGSARREYERRRDNREANAKEKLGRLSGIYLALSNEPQSTTAWARGSHGEKVLGDALERLHDENRVIVLHDRLIPGTRANIDHIAMTRSGGVWAIDAKRYAGKVQKIDRGGWFSTDLRLYVGKRDCSKLVTGMTKQTAAILAALGEPLIEEFAVEVRAALCFVDAEWSFFARPFSLEGVWIGWGKALGEQLVAPGELEPEHLMTLAKRVANALPPA